MSKQILKKAGVAATESILRDLMPFLEIQFRAIEERFKNIDERFKSMDERFVALHQEIKALSTKLDEVDRRLDARIDSLRDEMINKSAAQLDTINEVSHRITKLDGRVEGFMELFGKMFEPVRIPVRKRKAG